MCIDKCLTYNTVIVTPDTLVSYAIALMRSQKQQGSSGCVLVVDRSSPVGILTQGDVVRLLAEGLDFAATKIERVMTQPVITMTQQECQHLESVWSCLQRHSINYLPILNDEGEIIGVIDSQILVQSFTPPAETRTVEEDTDNQQGDRSDEAIPTPTSSQRTLQTELERFFELNPSMLCIASFDGYFKIINPAFTKTLGFSEEELLAEPFINFVHPEDRAATLAELANLTAGNTTISFENRYRTKNGDYRWLLWTTKPYLEEEILYAAARDITERKQSELALKESEARWQLALKGANDGIWDWNVKTNEVFFSRRWKEMLGYAEEEIGNNLEEWSKRVHPDDLGWVTELIQDHFAGKTPFYISEHRVRCKDGSYKWILDRGQALWDEAGNVVRMTGSHTDITQRKEAEAKLAKSENLLRTIIESEPECVKLLDREGKLLEINPAGLAMIEADSLAEVVGKSVYPLVNSDYRQAFIELTQSVFEGKSGKLEFQLTGHKGTQRWLSTNAVPLPNGDKITALLGVTRDISERKRTELQLQQERDFSNAIIDTVGALVAVLDCEGTIIRFNRTCEQISGYSFAEVAGKQIWEFLVDSQEKKAVKAVFERLLAGQVPNQYQHSWLAKDGSRHLISWSNTALFDARGAVEFIIATGIDVTEQRRVWDKLEHQYRETQLLAEITRKIRMSIELEDILQTAVTEVQHLLACDRVLIVKLQANQTALPISESILPGLPPMLGYELADPLLVGQYVARYRQGKSLAIDNLATASISPEIEQLLRQFEIQAKLVVPILSQQELKGLIVVHQCDRPRQWQGSEIRLLNQLADQIGVAISQAQLLDHLEEMVAQRTSELSTTNQLLQAEIVERELTEAALRENQQRLTGILDNADEAIISINEQQHIQLFNQGAERVFGYQAKEVMGQPLDILIPKALRQVHRQHVEQFSQSSKQSRRMGERSTNVYGRRKNGEVFPAEASVAKLQTNVGMLFTVMLKDITERKQAQEKLKASSSLLAKAEKIAKIGSWEYNLKTNELTWSEELFEILGFERESTVPLCDRVIERIHPDDRLLVKNTLYKGHAEGKPWQLNYRWILPNGTIKYLESRGEPTRSDRGDVLKVWGTIMDISQRIEAEQSLQRSEEQLRLITDSLPILIAYIDDRQRYRYNNRTYETWFGKSRSSFLGRPMKELLGENNYRKLKPYVETALAGKAVTFENQPTTENGNTYWIAATYIPDFDLKGRVRGFFSMVDDISDRKAIEQMKSEFISIASHEMRTPLTSIHGVIKLLNAGRLGEISATGQQMLEMALRNSDRLVRLVNDILDIEKMESGRDRLEKQTCDSAELIQQAIDTLRSMAEEHQITLETNSPSIKLNADRDRIVQTLTNLISNAIKFSAAGSKVWLTSTLQETEVLFSVKDRGRGIPKDKLETIFERFQQVDASDSRQKGGTGLGLAICRHIVEQHKGKIWVASVYGEGSTFYFSIPQ
ncbi:MAG: PAS domain S-box protein [Pleurocapsa sp. MO_226.B13]|nr:PAS domain S-box protein [Pleurocapsa sp. MO_226.B13]